MTPIRHFFASSSLKSSRLSIRGIGIQERMRPMIVDRPAGTGDFLFMYFYEAAWIQTREGLRKHEPGTIVLWGPEHGHYYGNKDYVWSHSWLHCDGSFIRRCVKSQRLPFNAPIRLPDATMVEKYLFHIDEEVTQFVHPDERIVSNLLENWMREIRRVTRGGARKQNVPRELLELKSYIDSNYQRALALDELALRIHLSVPHLCSLFKKSFGSPVMAYVIGQRLQQAAYLLRDRNLRVTDVARQVGYDDLFYFSKLFKDRYGVSPREFRRRTTATEL